MVDEEVQTFACISPVPINGTGRMSAARHPV